MTKPARRRYFIARSEFVQPPGLFQSFDIAQLLCPDRDIYEAIEAPHDSVVLSREDAKDIYEFVIMARERRKLQYELKEILEGAMKN